MLLTNCLASPANLESWHKLGYSAWLGGRYPLLEMASGAFLPPLLSFEFDGFILLSFRLVISPAAFSLSNYQSFCPSNSVQKSFSFIIILNRFDYLKVLLLKSNQSEKVKLHN